MSWRETTLGECAKFLSGGTPRKAVAEYWNGDIPWVGSGEMSESFIRDTALRVTREGAESGSRLVPENTVLVVVRGMSLAKDFRISLTMREMTFNQDVKALVCAEGIRSRFLFYALKERKDHIRDLATDASHGTKKLETDQLKALVVKVPDTVEEQDKVISILSAYDDLIENNRRRIGLLEQAARLLYREWFVHLRFPGHETAKVVDGLPEGWERKRLGTLTTKLGSGATPKGGESAYEQSGITLIRSLNVYDYSFHDDGLVYLNDEQATKLANVTVESGDVLLNITGASVARCCIVPDRHLPARVNQHVMIIRVDPQMASNHFVLHSINSHQNKERLLSIARAGGATREALTKDTMAGFEMVFPTTELTAEFHAKAVALHRQAEALSAHIGLLTSARDLLLPRLMDGRIPVYV